MRVRRGIGRRWVASQCAVLVAAVLVVPSAAAAQPSLGAAKEVRLAAAIDRELARAKLPGAIVGVERVGRRPWIRASGVANLESRRPMRADEHVRIGSVTKAFVTTALMELAEEGRLSLDEPIADYVAGVPGGEAITLRRLGNMTSGLSD